MAAGFWDLLAWVTGWKSASPVIVVTEYLQIVGAEDDYQKAVGTKTGYQTITGTEPGYQKIKGPT